MIFVILILAVFFAINMGGASFAASFAASYGGRAITKKNAALLFILFVILGSVLLGSNVSNTLGKEIISQDAVGTKEIFIIFLTAGLSMYVANLMRIPQSTSLVTVAAIAGVGAAHNAVIVKTLFYLFPFWIILPVLSFVFAYMFVRPVYPPRKTNFWIYQKYINKQGFLKKFVIFANCYNAFSVGTNNVANVVGPLMGETTMSVWQLLLIFGLFYGLGAFVFDAPMKTASQEIVPLGLLTASIISLVCGTLMIIASWLGVPQSFVMLKMSAIFAVATIKHGGGSTFNNPLTKKTFYTWTINPLLTFVAAFIIGKLVL